jgi:hypothetical protein
MLVVIAKELRWIKMEKNTNENFISKAFNVMMIHYGTTVSSIPKWI